MLAQRATFVGALTSRRRPAWNGSRRYACYELSQAERTSYFDDLALAAQVLQKVFRADKMNYNLPGNVVPHLHTHILPGYFTDTAPHRAIDPALNGHEVFLTASEYQDRIRLILDHLQVMRA